jgi:hypothetical protein
MWVLVSVTGALSKREEGVVEEEQPEPVQVLAYTRYGA